MAARHNQYVGLVTDVYRESTETSLRDCTATSIVAMDQITAVYHTA